MCLVSTTCVACRHTHAACTQQNTTHTVDITRVASVCAVSFSRATYVLCGFRSMQLDKEAQREGWLRLLGGQRPASLFSCSVNQNNKNKSARAAELTAEPSREQKQQPKKTIKTQERPKLSSKLLLSCCKLLCPLQLPPWPLI